MMKICVVCKQEKKFAEFHKNSYRSDGLTGTCKLCAIDRANKYYATNKEKCIVSVSAWRNKNKDKFRNYNATYRNKNRIVCRARSKAWGIVNREKCRTHWANRRAKKRSSIPAWADHEIIANFYQEAKYQDLEVDHIVPLVSESVCGLHWEGNMQLLSRNKNISKGNRYWPDMPKIITQLRRS